MLLIVWDDSEETKAKRTLKALRNSPISQNRRLTGVKLEGRDLWFLVGSPREARYSLVSDTLASRGERFIFKWSS